MLWHEHLRRVIKVAGLGTLHYSGILSLIRRNFAKDSAVILMYHRVAPRGEGVQDYSPNGMTVTPLEFEMQLRFLRKNYEIVPLTQIVSAVRDKRLLPSGCCAITFDDGWRSVYKHAFPILRSMSVPATMFLTTGYMGGQTWHWEERTRYLMALVHGERERILSVDEFKEVRRLFDASILAGLLSTRASRLPIYVLAKVRELKGPSAEMRDRTLKLLESTAAAVQTGDQNPFLDWAQVREMATSGIEFGNHTVTHPVLLDLTDAAVGEEVDLATKELRLQTGTGTVNFAYPFGKHDPRVEKLVRDSGCASACTTKLGAVRTGDNVYALNRINVSSEVASNEPLFAGRLLCM